MIDRQILVEFFSKIMSVGISKFENVWRIFKQIEKSYM